MVSLLTGKMREIAEVFILSILAMFIHSNRNRRQDTFWKTFSRIITSSVNPSEFSKILNPIGHITLFLFVLFLGMFFL